MLHELVGIAAWSAVLIIAVPLLTFSCEVLLGVRANKAVEPAGTPYQTCILMPAHNEGEILEDTLDHLLFAVPAFANILVVADNCTDQTADIARARGVAVLERQDAERRGKGYALAFGRDWLRQSPPACVIVLDADCKTDGASIKALTAAAVSREVPVQATYAFAPDRSAPAKVQISSFAVWIKNVVRQRGARNMGGGAILTGTGMAFPWAIFDTLPLATNSIVEDLELGVELTRSGKVPFFLECARVTSAAATERATLAQRLRWEHGFLAIALTHGAPTLVQGVKTLNRPLALMGLHLLVPPLALLMCVACGMSALLTAAAMWSGVIWPAAALTGLTGLAAGSVFFAWLSGGSRWLSARSLLMIPLYVVWKLPIYLRFAIGQRSEWVRTDRTSS